LTIALSILENTQKISYF